MINRVMPSLNSQIVIISYNAREGSETDLLELFIIQST